MKRECDNQSNPCQDMGDTAYAEREACVDAACREANVTGIQKEIVLLFLADGMRVPQIRLKLHLKRVSEVQELLEVGLKRLSGVPGFWDEARRFPHDLVFCAADARSDDEREPGVRGVEPDRASDPVHSGKLISGDDPRLRQDLRSAARLWLRKLNHPQRVAG